jgi:hypothetical protein
MDALDILKYGHLTVVSTVEALPEDEWETPNVCGWWSSKNIIAHLASFEVVLVEILSSFVDDAPTPTLKKYSESPQGFNDVSVAERQHLTPADTWAEYEGTQGRTMEILAEIPVEVRRQKGRLPWYGPEYDLEDFIVYTFYGHKREHMAQINVFRDLLKSREKQSR